MFNAIRGKETSKLETYLVDIRRKLGVALKHKVFRRRKQPELAQAS